MLRSLPRESLKAGRACLSRLLVITALVASTGFAAQAAETRLLAFGDSLVHGYGLDEQDTFPAQLEAALRERGHRVQVLNAGNSGDTSAAGLARLDWALADDPDAVLVVLGANDALRGMEPAETYGNLTSLLADLEEKELPILLAGMMAPRNMGPEYAAEFDGLFPRLAERRRQRAGKMSGGERQMVAMGRALMLDPKLLMLDEPSAGLAPLLVDMIFEKVKEINEAGVAVLMVEQNAKKSLALANRGYVLATGQNQVDGPGEKLLGDPEVARLYLGG